MARKPAHEDHVNHEAWAIPYGDLITLLLAFFVVMYAVSSINEGKYRVLSDALSEAFGGPPKSLRPLQVGKAHPKGTAPAVSASQIALRASQMSVGGTMRDLKNPQVIAGKLRTEVPQQQVNAQGNTGYEKERAKLEKIADDMAKALGDLVTRKLVVIRRTETYVEIEIKTDILFDSGSAALDSAAVPALTEIADIVAPYPNLIRIEGHTDNVPISTWQFPSNWELSAARAASVLHILEAHRIDPKRMSVLGLGAQQPKADNRTPEGRNANRRVTLVLLGEGAETPPVAAGDAPPPSPAAPAPSPVAATPAPAAAMPAAAAAIVPPPSGAP